MTSLAVSDPLDRYDRSQISPGIAHIGLGAFARAHLAVFTDELIATDPEGSKAWGIVGINLRRSDTRDALARRQGRYTLIERNSDDAHLHPIGSVLDVLVEPEQPVAVAALLADPAIRIVTMTVTETGYGPAQPAMRVLVDCLRGRRDTGMAPPTIVVLDNLVDSGGEVRRQLESAAEPDLARWIHDNVSCPSSMVDRIVPATTDVDRQLVRDELGIDDAWPVCAEPYTEWVVEDRFPAGRPDWDRVGVRFVDDAAPWVRLKLQALNAAHLAVACLGRLAGHATVAEAMRDQSIRDHLETLVRDECMVALQPLPDGVDADDHLAVITSRFENRALHHRCTQIISDGSAKILQRFVPNVRTLRASGASADQHAAATAAWLAVHKAKASWSDEIHDPLDDILTTEPPETILDRSDVFGAVGRDGHFRAAVLAAYRDLDP